MEATTPSTIAAGQIWNGSCEKDAIGAVAGSGSRRSAGVLLKFVTRYVLRDSARSGRGMQHSFFEASPKSIRVAVRSILPGRRSDRVAFPIWQQVEYTPKVIPGRSVLAEEKQWASLTAK